jgi:SAM-dependent methyltransferase
MKKLIKLFLPKTFIEQYRSYKKQKTYKGNEVHCPICDSSYRVFGPYGIKKRENAKCFNCGSLERHRLMFIYLNERFNLFNSKSKIKLLHFAPERIFYELFSTLDSIEYFPCDLFPDNYNYNGKTKITKADITKIPFEDNSFDFIICSHVLEHIPNDHLAMTELYRVLKKNGNSLLQVPIDYSREKTYEDHTIVTPEDRLRIFGHDDHVRIYGKDYKIRLENAGFTVNELDYVSTMNEIDVRKYGLIDSELIYHCSK